VPIGNTRRSGPCKDSCECEKAHYDEMVRSDKRKDTEMDSDKSKAGE
jgi:hypothetical protein